MTRQKQARAGVWKLIALGVFVIGLFVAAKFLPVEGWLKSFNQWVGQMGLTGVFIFIGVYVVATVLLLPGVILTLGAGFAFGLWKGFLAVSAGSTIGAAYRETV